MDAPPDSPPPKTNSALVVALVLGVVFLGGAMGMVVAGGLVWWQYHRVAGEVSAGVLTVMNDRAEPVRVECRGADDASGEPVAVVVPASDAATVDVPPRPAACTAVVVSTGEAVAGWQAADPPLADESWTLLLPEPPAPPVEEAVAVEPAPPAGDEQLTVRSAREAAVYVACTHGSDHAPTRDTIPARGSVTVAVGAESRCEGTLDDGTVVWLWVRSAASGEQGAFTAEISGPAVQALAPASTGSSSTTARSSGSARSSSTGASASRDRAEVPEPEPEPEEDEKDLPPAPAGDDMTLVRMEVKKAAKLRGAKYTIDGKAVSVPGQKAISTGIHTFEASKEGVIDLECRLVATGKDISLVVDPDAPACP